MVYVFQSVDLVSSWELAGIRDFEGSGTATHRAGQVPIKGPQNQLLKTRQAEGVVTGELFRVSEDVHTQRTVHFFF